MVMVRFLDRSDVVHRTTGSNNNNNSTCPGIAITVVSLFLIIKQLIDGVSCFTHHDNIPSSALRRSRQHQGLILPMMTPSSHILRILQTSDERALIRRKGTMLSSSPTVVIKENNKPNEKRVFRLPTINIFENNRGIRRVENHYKDHSYWVKHRSSSRLLHHIQTMPRSIIYQTIRRPVRYITYISTFVVIWNSIVLLAKATTATLDMPHPMAFLFGLLSKKLLLARIPLDPLVITSPMLGLLLVFRTNSCYKRYEEALINWTKTKNQSRNIIRMAKSMRNMSGIVLPQSLSNPTNRTVVTLQQEQQRSELIHLGLCLWVFARTMKRQLSHADDDEIAYRNDIDHCYDLPAIYRKRLILKVQHRPNYALQYLSDAIEDLSYIPSIRKNEIHTAITIFEQCLGSNERILSSPVPLFYTRWTARFLFLWLAFCPFALYTHVINLTALLSSISTTSLPSIMIILMRSFLLIPMMYVISMFMFGIDEIAMQCEEPFSILPQQEFCNEIYNNCIDIANYDYYENDSIVAPDTNVDVILQHTTRNSKNVHMDMTSETIGQLPEIKDDDTIPTDVSVLQHQQEAITRVNV